VVLVVQAVEAKDSVVQQQVALVTHQVHLQAKETMVEMVLQQTKPFLLQAVAVAVLVL
jgi:hypothetical protein